MIIDCLSKAIVLFVLYNIITIMLFGIPKSLGITYYLYEEKQKSLKTLFPAMMILLSIFLLPSWVGVSTGNTFQFTAFLSAFSILFVGITPAFKNSKTENLIHIISASIASVCAILWIIIVTKFWYIILIVFIFVLIASILTKTLKTCYIYWIEIIIFISTFISITLHYILK